MPFKQVTCSICNKTVNKAQTYFIGNDKRACKEHEGVIAKKESFDASKQRKTIFQQNRQKANADYQAHYYENIFKPKCFVCCVTGIRSQEYYLKVVVNMKKNEMVGTDPFKDIAPKEPPIHIMTKEKCKDILHLVRDIFRPVVDMTNVVALCGRCCMTLKIDPIDVPPKKMFEIGNILRVAMEPIIKQIASQELIRDN